MNNKVLDCIALTLAIIGAVNWGLIGFFSFVNCNNKLSIQLVRSLLCEEVPAQLRREP